MRYLRPAAATALYLAYCAASGQGQSLSITNYELLSQVPSGSNLVNTYQVTLVNTGEALTGVKAKVNSLDPAMIRVVPGTGTLNFPAVPANGQVTSANTVSFSMNRKVAFDPSYLQWTFHMAGGPVANAGLNDTVEVGRVVILNGSGSTNPSGIGVLTYSWAFTSRPPGSSATLGNSSTPFAFFTADVAGEYTIRLTVSNGVASSSASVTMSTVGTPPVANAGPNQTVKLGSLVVLNGSGSTSTSGQPLSYSWTPLTLPIGSTAFLSGNNTVSPTFVADKPGVYEMQLIVNDGLPSSPATVTITTQTGTPVANAGAHQVVDVGANVQLSGAGSTDPNGLPLTYSWQLVTLPAGSTAVFNLSRAVNPTFTVDRAGTYVAQLIVNDGTSSSQPATVTITTEAPLAPVANAGVNRTVGVDSLVTLSGGGTDPQNRALTYQWSLINKPSGSTASLSSSVIADPTFVADREGTYIGQLIVNDGVMNSAPATVTISTTCTQPTANPGTNQNVTVGQTVTLNGTGSGDVCSDPLTFAWSLTTRPSGSGATISNPAIAQPSLRPDVAGIYVAQLIVNNGFTSSNPATVTITASGSIQNTAMSFSPNSLVVNGTSTQSLTLVLAAAAPPSGLVVKLSSSAMGIATVPATVAVAANATSALVPVTGVSAGSAVITASAANYTNATASISVSSTAGITVNWHEACWENASVYGDGQQGNLQSISFSIVTPTPVVLESTLFYTSNCDPSQGQDNGNDTGGTIGSGGWIFSFIHHPNEIPSSALYWIGPRTADGKCPAGAPCSGCMTYTKSTPKCQ
ncbi:MAG TPA: PKD domain-containing protein [Bryobacteraceae bacterium]|nr:PKD domain-containing protein [Bryobacteraceae bacterium]